MSREENIARFEELFKKITRDGADKLLEFIRKSDFYTAPASTRFHNAKEGGLLEHSLNVYELLSKKLHTEGTLWNDIMKEKKITEENLLIIGLLHDICKVNYYVQDYKNQKTYDKEVVSTYSPQERKRDSKGEYVWETVPVYTVEDQMPYGHGEKSVMIIEAYMTLKWSEKFAIRWHMGFSTPKEEWNILSDAMRKYPIIMAIMEADLEATHILEAEGSPCSRYS